MLPKELLDQVKKLNDDDKLALFRTLLADPALEQYTFDPTGLRYNYELAQTMLELLEQTKVSTEPEIE
ncbi:MAG: hypothetical protein OXI40_08620 [Chloroflexota bacterium]|nr:hypothetical protein [Chloroflexota bacterium]